MHVTILSRKYHRTHAAHRRHRLPHQKCHLRKYPRRYSDKPYRLQLWDTAGQEKYKSLVPAYLRDANCGILVFEIPRKESFDSLRAWLALFREHAPSKTPILLLANKSDLLSLTECPFAEEIERFRQ